MEFEALADTIRSRAATLGRPTVVGVSGFCGAGKSTLVRRLTAGIDDAVRMRGDDFLDPVRSHRRSSDWDGVERRRLVEEVLLPFREQRPGSFRRYDWTARRLGAPEPVPAAEIMIVDLIGLFHPDSLPALDLTVWCEADQEIAARRGIARDASLGRDHTRLWREIWMPNDRDFAERFRPRSAAEVMSIPTGEDR